MDYTTSQLSALVAQAKGDTYDQRETRASFGRITVIAIPYRRVGPPLKIGKRVVFTVDGFVMPKSMVLGFIRANPEPVSDFPRDRMS
jgi:hypothetical protein